MNQPTFDSSLIDTLLTEASDPSTSPERLRQLSEWEQPEERKRLRRVIAANPKVDDELLWELASDFPKEVVDNPRFQLLQLSGEPWWTRCDLEALVMLLPFLVAQRPVTQEFLLQSLSRALMEASPLQVQAVNHQVVEVEALVPAAALAEGQETSSTQPSEMQPVTFRFVAPWCDAAIELSAEHGPATRQELLHVLQGLGVDAQGSVDEGLLADLGWFIEETDNEGGPPPNLQLETPLLSQGWEAVLSTWRLDTGEREIAISNPDRIVLRQILQENDGDAEFYNEIRDPRLIGDLVADLLPDLPADVKLIPLLRAALNLPCEQA